MNIQTTLKSEILQIWLTLLIEVFVLAISISLTRGLVASRRTVGMD